MFLGEVYEVKNNIFYLTPENYSRVGTFLTSNSVISIENNDEIRFTNKGARYSDGYRINYDIDIDNYIYDLKVIITAGTTVDNTPLRWQYYSDESFVAQCLFNNYTVGWYSLKSVWLAQSQSAWHVPFEINLHIEKNNYSLYKNNTLIFNTTDTSVLEGKNVNIIIFASENNRYIQFKDLSIIKT